MKKAIAFAVLALAAGCARMAFYTEAGLEGTETGVKFYTAKPYLLVARTGAKDKPVEVSLIYVPDLANPVYAKPHSGLGSAKLSLALSNGMLTSFGQETDPKIGELFGAIGGLQKDLATAKKTAKETALLDQAGVDYSRISAALREIAAELTKYFNEAKQKGLLVPDELKAGAAIIESIKRASELLSSPFKADTNAPAAMLLLKSALENWDKQIGAQSSATSGPEPILRRNIDKEKDKTRAQLALLTPKEPEQATFTLYEILITKDGTVLKEVKF